MGEIKGGGAETLTMVQAELGQYEQRGVIDGIADQPLFIVQLQIKQPPIVCPQLPACTVSRLVIVLAVRGLSVAMVTGYFSSMRTYMPIYPWLDEKKNIFFKWIQLKNILFHPKRF